MQAPIPLGRDPSLPQPQNPSGPQEKRFPGSWGTVYSASDWYNPITSDDVAINAAFAAMVKDQAVRTRAAGDVGSASASISTVLVSNPIGRTLNLQAPIVLPQFSRIVFDDGVFLIPANPANYVIDCSVAFRNEIIGAHFIAKKAIRMTNGNLDTSKLLIEECLFSGGSDVAGEFQNYLQVVSGKVTVRRCTVLGAPQWMDVFCTDDILFDDCWINGYSTALDRKPQNTSSIRLKGQSFLGTGENNHACFRDCFFIPESGVPGPALPNTRWIDIYDFYKVVFVNTNFSGENAGFPPVYYFGTTNSLTAYPYVAPSGLTFISCQLACGDSGRADRGAVVFKTGVPQHVHFLGGTSINDAFVFNDQIAGGVTAYLAGIATAAAPYISLQVLGLVGWGFALCDSAATLAALTPYLQSYVPAVGGRNAFKTPALYAPDLPFGSVPPAAAANDGQVFTDKGNGWLGFNTQGKTFRAVAVQGNVVQPGAAYVKKAANYTLVPYVDKYIEVDTTAGAVTITLPNAATDLAYVGWQCEIVHSAGANNMILVPRTGTINGAANITTNVVGKGYRPVFDGVNYSAATS